MSVFGQNLKQLRERYGFSQSEFGEVIGVTKSTISQWEKGKSYPRRKFINLLMDKYELKMDFFDVETDSSVVISVDSCVEDFKKIPFYFNVNAAAGSGCFNENEEYELLHVKDLPSICNFAKLFCIVATGDSMEPVLKNGSLIVVDPTQNCIVDGHMYVFRQGDMLRVKVFSYERQMIKLKSYNKNYSDELYRFDELDVVGKVVFHATKID